MNRILPGLLVAIVALAGCSKKFLFTADPNKFNLNNLDFEYLNLKSKIKYEDGENDNKGTANIRMKNDSIIWFSITPGMGIEAARGVILTDSIKIIDRINKAYSLETISGLSEKIHFDMSMDMLEAILIGNLIWPVDSTDKVTKIKGYYTIPRRYQNLTVTSYIGSSSRKLEKIKAVSDSTGNTLDISYSAFQLVDEKVVPTQIDILIKYKAKEDNTQKISNITIEHAKVEIDKDTKFSFSIPKKYTRK